ncbi:MAG: nicotinamidase [Acidocella sp. 20-57-95]|nr:MAG: nicotinamidase [Acidocella sp. 20-57-95]OYV60780.1 MAG: nicotinamidase [Acidocella sp. 21-58-7]HQT64919.1 isochorismatase family cysteine hydrolase [Acidocella sp.]HQU05510.1 isochorismatase family cysteine hydrolase [Acidocella sp.]
MKKTALLVIDVQNIYAAPESPLYVSSIEQSLQNINALAEAFAKAGKPVVYVRHAHRADGRDAGRMFDFGGAAEPVSFVEGEPESAYVPGLKIVPGALHITKRRYSSFEGTELDAILRTLGVNTVAITGYMTNFCCDTTARSAHDRDYFVDFIADATGAPALSETYTEAHIIEAVTTTLAAGFAQIHDTKTYLQSIA